MFLPRTTARPGIRGHRAAGNPDISARIECNFVRQAILTAMISCPGKRRIRRTNLRDESGKGRSLRRVRAGGGRGIRRGPSTGQLVRRPEQGDVNRTSPRRVHFDDESSDAGGSLSLSGLKIHNPNHHRARYWPPGPGARCSGGVWRGLVTTAYSRLRW